MTIDKVSQADKDFGWTECRCGRLVKATSEGLRDHHCMTENYGSAQDARQTKKVTVAVEAPRLG